MGDTRSGARVRLRQIVVWLHVVTSVGWMSQALALMALLAAVATGDGSDGGAYARAAEHLDNHVLALLANASAFTGLLLAAATPWGLLRHWWVAVKFVLTFAQLYLGIFVLSGALRAAAARPDVTPVVPLTVGTALMAGALALQVWMSVAKPWGRTGLGRGKPPSPPVWLLATGIAAPVIDTAGSVVLGYPLPAASVAVLAVVGGWRVDAARRAGGEQVPVRPRAGAGQAGRSPSSRP